MEIERVSLLLAALVLPGWGQSGSATVDVYMTGRDDSLQLLRPGKELASEIFRKAGVHLSWNTGELPAGQRAFGIRTVEQAPESAGPNALAATHLSNSAAVEITMYRVAIRVFNRANVAKPDLAQAMKVASAIFEEAGIAVSWVEGSADDHESTALDFSANPAYSSRRMGELHLALTVGPKTGVLTTTLGFALPCAKYGSDASIFVDRCEAVMQHTSASFAKVLGHAIAHEIGHVLLGSNGHSRAGLMRANWDKADWQRVVAAHIPIAPADAVRMKANPLMDTVERGH
jgi:hypothetical protein